MIYSTSRLYPLWATVPDDDDDDDDDDEVT